jgi:D-arabinose 1-dehydrogenase-like Zn-dependent alcohol dehydrogenase
VIKEFIQLKKKETKAMVGLFKTAVGDGNMELRETSDPKPGPGQVVVEVKAAEICGSDLHILHSDVKVPITPPVIVGHEFSGTISNLGDVVTCWNTGERVTAEPSASICGQCPYCRTGCYNLCPELKISGF